MNPDPSARLFPPRRSAHPRRVVVTGGGVITALGQGWAPNAAGFRAGHCGIRPVSLFDVSGQRVKVAAEAVVPETIPGSRLSPKRLSRSDRATRLLLTAGHEAWTQSGWETTDRLPLILATTSGGMPLGEAYYRDTLTHPTHRRQQPTRILSYQAQRQGIDLLDSLGCSGSVSIIANACASGSNAIGHAWETVRSGQADRVLAGGYDGLCHLVFAGFDSLQALSPTQCRPFDAARDGLALGEGAAVLALETLESARHRSADILGEIIGYGASTDTHHLTQPHPEGAAALASMHQATQVAGIHPSEVHYINAHGTGTVLNDAAEAAALNAWAGEAVSHLHVSSTKASVGHLLGAAGAVEAAVCLMALDGQWLPPSLSTVTVDPACRFQVITQPAQASLNIALSNSFGFGGANATLIFRRWT
ncbi:MAG: beta-ketoacyl-[acyl-carrier-protein] synthase family protein [Verrucomicrobia bacterium]|nr:beta-ketoacyl-[acyl-carrier-protein] synthase family protein [Verrucomicrobiota bacterium]